jgi:hypothetical protein
MVSTSARRRVVLTLICACLASPVAIAAQCPASTVSCIGEDNGEEKFNLTESSSDPTRAVAHNESGASYELMVGRVHAAAYVDEDAYLHRSFSTAVDAFEVHNVAGAWIKVRLHYSSVWVSDPAGRMAWAIIRAQVSAGDQTATAESEWYAITGVLELELVALEGVPSTISYEASATAWGYYPWASMTCTLEIVALPEQAVITSCNGFGSPALPVRETTWGSIKALYR